jgi:hypothetical protein
MRNINISRIIQDVNFNLVLDTTGKSTKSAETAQIQTPSIPNLSFCQVKF